MFSLSSQEIIGCSPCLVEGGRRLSKVTVICMQYCTEANLHTTTMQVPVSAL